MLVDETQAIPLSLGEELNRVHHPLETHKDSRSSKRPLLRFVYLGAWIHGPRVVSQVAEWALDPPLSRSD
jgi:hypothetical protein